MRDEDPATTLHPGAEELTAFGQGRLLTQAALERIEQHLSNCGACCDFLLGIDPDRFEQAVKAAEPTVGIVPEPLRIIAGYEVLDELGRGGMGVVYRARQVGLDRVVALKQIRAGLVPGEEELRRFNGEAQALARLQHPRIIQIFDVGEQDGVPYLATEYVGGTTLRGRLETGPLPLRSAAELVRDLADAIEFAHRHGIVHRDLKPGNILLAQSDQSVVRREPGARQTSLENAVEKDDDRDEPRLDAKIADFGLAKLLDADQEQTRTGAILGTPAYMAPEQAGGARSEIGPAVDIYALGAILYEALTGRPPFRGASDLETLDQVRNLDPVPPRRLRPALPRDLQVICLKCLGKAPRERYASAADLADDLRQFLSGRPIRARPVGPVERSLRWSKRRPAAAALVAVVIVSISGLLGGVSFHVSRLREEIDRTDRQRRQADLERQRADENYQKASATVRRMLKHLEGSEGTGIPRLMELAERQATDSLEFFDELSRRQNPPDARVLEDLADACLLVGQLQVHLGRLDAGRARFQQAARIWRQLAGQFPDSSDYSEHLADTNGKLAVALMAESSRLPEAVELLIASVAEYERLHRNDPENGMVRESLARTSHNLGTALQLQGRLEEAEQHLLRAVTLRTQLAREHTEHDHFQAAAADGQINLGLIYANTGRREEAARAYDAAVALLLKGIETTPANKLLPIALGAAYLNWSNLVREGGDPERAVDLCSRGIERLGPLLDLEPGLHLARERLFQLHGARAQAHEARSAFADSFKDWDLAAGLAQTDALRAVCRLQGAFSLARGGRHAEASAAVAELSELPLSTAPDFYNFACVCGRAGEAARGDIELTAEQRSAAVGRYTVQAVALLRRAARDGFFRDAAQLANLKVDPDLDALRERQEFHELLDELREAAEQPASQ